jgi:GNAT superfamily N-acetyltransferase
VINFELTKTNRLILQQAFQHNRRVDLGIECVLENQMGKAWVDNLENPQIFVIDQTPFYYFAGNVDSPAGQAYLEELPVYQLFISMSAGWLESIRTRYGIRLQEMPRYQCSAENLSLDHIQQQFARFGHPECIRPIDLSLAQKLYAEQDHFIDLHMFDSAEDFIQRGIGHVYMEEETILAGAYSSLVCSRGIEVSVFVLDDHRRKGIATALSCALIQSSLARGLNPHWDAANPESIKLAQKLGYRFAGEYTAYYLLPEKK